MFWYPYFEISSIFSGKFSLSILCLLYLFVHLEFLTYFPYKQYNTIHFKIFFSVYCWIHSHINVLNIKLIFSSFAVLSFSLSNIFNLGHIHLFLLASFYWFLHFSVVMLCRLGTNHYCILNAAIVFSWYGYYEMLF